MKRFLLFKLLIVLKLELSIVKGTGTTHLNMIKDGRDKDVKPCNDFYTNVCGFLKELDPSKKWSAKKIITSQVYSKIKEIYNNKKNINQEFETKKKLKMDIAWLDTCTDSDTSGRRKKLKKYIKNFETCSKKKCSEQNNWQIIEAGFAGLRGKSTFFKIGYINGEGLKFRDPDGKSEFEAFLMSENSNIDRTILYFVKKFKSSTKISTAEELRKFDDDLSELLWTTPYGQHYEWMSLEMFQIKMTKYLLENNLKEINWITIFNAMFKNTELEASLSSIKFHVNIKYWNDLNLFLSKTPNYIIVTYIYLIIIFNNRIEWKDKQLVKSSKRLLDKCLSKSPIINGFLSEIANTVEMKEKKDYVSRMFKEIQKQYKIEFENSAMNSKLKTSLQEAVENMEIYFPNFNETVDNKHIMENQISYDFKVGENIVENLFNFEKAQFKLTVKGFLELHKLKNPLNIDPSAFYTITANSVTIPTEKLFSLFIDVNNPISINYGSMGFTVGHEMSHGVIDEVESFLWTDAETGMFKSTLTKYNDYTDCLLDQLDKLEVDERSTLDESQADAFGVQIAYKTLKRIICAGENTDTKVTKLDCKHWRKLFFMSLPTFYCKYPVDEHYFGDKYPPAPIRINQIASNLDEFNEAFGCTEDHTLFRVDKCHFWFDQLDDETLP